MPDNNNWKSTWESTVMPTYGTPAVQLVSGSGSRVTDTEGREYVDLLAGIAVNALGHAHPAIVEAVTKQVSTLGHTSNVFAHPQVLDLAARLQELIAPGAQVFFSNSGAEANEAAFKIARRTGRSRILAAEHGFHGRTMGSLALTGQPDKRAPFEPMPAGSSTTLTVTSTHWFLVADGGDGERCVRHRRDLPGVHPGETGVCPRPKDSSPPSVNFVTSTDPHGRRRGTGRDGRTGHWFGYQADLPDGVFRTSSPGQGPRGGMSIGACVAATGGPAVGPGNHGSTFGGNPVACAAGNAVVDTIRTENLLEHVTHAESLFREELEALDSVELVRGRGLMLGVVLTEPRPGLGATALEKGL